MTDYKKKELKVGDEVIFAYTQFKSTRLVDK